MGRRRRPRRRHGASPCSSRPDPPTTRPHRAPRPRGCERLLQRRLGRPVGAPRLVVLHGRVRRDVEDRTAPPRRLGSTPWISASGASTFVANVSARSSTGSESSRGMGVGPSVLALLTSRSSPPDTASTRGPVRSVGDVPGDAGRADLGRNRRKRKGIAPVDDDVPAVLRQFAGERPSETPRTACDQCRLHALDARNQRRRRASADRSRAAGQMVLGLGSRKDGYR